MDGRTSPRALISPEWNVNKLKFYGKTEESSALISPEWNVNDILNRTFIIGRSALISPEWNVNIATSPSKTQIISFNLARMECKPKMT